MRVWLDDMAIRDPSSGWTIVRTADEAIALLMTGQVEAISLDHDLQDFRQDPYPREITGMHVVRWMITNGVFPKVINVHSLNPDRGKFMVQDLNKAAPDGVIIKWWQFDSNIVKDLEKLLNSKDQ
jgi:hypothetical protein